MEQPRMAIGTLNESSLHSMLKRWYCERLREQAPGVVIRTEVPRDGYVIDIVAGDELIELQTANLGKLRPKLDCLLPDASVRVLYPIAVERVLVGARTGAAKRRRSPQRGQLIDVLDELVSLPRYLARQGFALEVLLIREEVRRSWNPQLRRRRGGWQTDDRSLLEVLGRYRLETPDCLWSLCEQPPRGDFDTADLAAALNGSRAAGQKLAYCLRALELIEPVGKSGNAVIYRRRQPSESANR
ncbi:MAG: hypothetical protein AAGG11_11720 [Pseudomonadota bacterium]